MTDPLFSAALAFVLRHEGGLVDNPSDPGGLTNLGISLRSYPQLGAAGIRALTPETVAPIYLNDWWEPHQFGAFPVPFGAKLFDSAVNMGAVPAIQLFQQACNGMGSNLTCDGVVGPVTIAAATALSGTNMQDAYTSALVKHYQDLTQSNPSLGQFLGEWIARANDWDIGSGSV